MDKPEGLNVLVPVSTPARTPRLLKLADALVSYYHGEATALSVVEVAPDRSLSEGALVVRRRRNLLRRLSPLAPGRHLNAAVHTGHTLEEGIRAAVRSAAADLLLLNWDSGRTPMKSDIESLVDDPPCDLALYRPGRGDEIRTVLLPVRGGPHAALALRIAQAVAAQHEAELTLLHINVPLWSAARRAREERYFEEVRRRVTYHRSQYVLAEAESIEGVLLEQAAQHDLVIMGAAARDETSPAVLGRIPSMLARRTSRGMIVVKTREPVTASTFRSGSEEQAREPDISEVVDRWFAENTFHSHEFRHIPYLLDLKERQGQTISLVLPTLNEEATIGKIVSTIKRQLVERYPLIDELMVIDSQSTDRTVEIVQELGVPVYQHPEVLPAYGTYRGKGEALWKSLQITRGDIVVWIDSDITGLHPKFVYGLIGPLLSQPQIGFVKGFYRRPLNLGGQRSATGGGRVTELTARPLINLFYPELSGIVQPLAGEMAGRRTILESIPFFTGYGVETGLLIDILQRFGLRAIAQTDLEERIHRNQSLLSLSKMAFAIVQVVLCRLGERGRLRLMEEMNTSMKLIHYSPEELFLEVMEIEEGERPPIIDLPEYRSRAGVVDGLVAPGLAGAGKI